uniref:Uncharacterized protein n=1 Tax=Timema shepardi TaxID=629360 RepID=A0A7R9B125_TIMSH|nr:unnamed protein product [Timema shepardi]
MTYNYNTTGTSKKHPTELRQYKNDKIKFNLQNPRPAPQRNQLTMEEVLFKKTKLAYNDPKAQSINKRAAVGNPDEGCVYNPPSREEVQMRVIKLNLLGLIAGETGSVAGGALRKLLNISSPPPAETELEAGVAVLLTGDSTKQTTLNNEHRCENAINQPSPNRSWVADLGAVLPASAVVRGIFGLVEPFGLGSSWGTVVSDAALFDLRTCRC